MSEGMWRQWAGSYVLSMVGVEIDGSAQKVPGESEVAPHRHLTHRGYSDINVYSM